MPGVTPDFEVRTAKNLSLREVAKLFGVEDKYGGERVLCLQGGLSVIGAGVLRSVDGQDTLGPFIEAPFLGRAKFLVPVGGRTAVLDRGRRELLFVDTVPPDLNPNLQLNCVTVTATGRLAAITDRMGFLASDLRIREAIRQGSRLAKEASARPTGR